MSRPVMASLLLCAAFAAAETSVATEVSSRALRGTVLEQKDKLRQLQSASDAWDAYSGYTGSAEGQAAGAGAAASQAASSGSFFDPLSGSAGYQISDGMGVGASGSTSGSAGVGFSWHFRRMAEASDSPGVSDLSSESASGRALQSDSIQITKRVDGTKSSSGCWGRTSTDFPDTAYLNSLPSGVTGSQRFTYTVNGDTVTVTAHIDTIDVSPQSPASLTV
uniref:Uncharacterized protein n=1 Tax=Chromera velia CCMP2878 TaxID=1169474 RepID=A0A0G4FWX7_9ALVE|eukprot:Cvel_19192.t1-p1 / transcript=Cvel_19192.t1 / gene=Cvel_19192 / organism=Chromera_velia_CCMP2878 / gene_product=hypothetical protein / transcript_product=hypothetical protein / location=Cvel_scaffold1637:31555-32214(-) / protein_length=220 / sequence_SO=supercontig / SO=protein_coding / is_pseudo=false